MRLPASSRLFGIDDGFISLESPPGLFLEGITRH